jgi:UDP:flavonoid glycosyltransferase YjiC (YdhE family)
MGATARRVISALASLPVRAIVTTGGVLDPDDLPTAHNVDVVGYLDHGGLMPGAPLWSVTADTPALPEPSPTTYPFW